jgi:hypothetical protein
MRIGILHKDRRRNGMNQVIIPGFTQTSGDTYLASAT